MGRKMLIALLGGILIVSIAAAQTTVPGGYVSGNWPASGSPYLIEGEITIHSDSTLIIEPGVDVIFQGHYKLIVNGLLEAVGTESDSILFTAADTSEGWHGIRFIDAPDSSHFTFCIIEYGKATGIAGTADSWGGGVFCENSNPVISHCYLRGNYAYRGGAVATWPSNQTNPIINYSNISGNSASNNGGAMYLACADWPDSSTTIVSHCTIENNTSSFEGGGVTCSGLIAFQNCIITVNVADGGDGGGIRFASADASITNCTIHGNSSTDHGGGLYLHTGSDITITNSIIWANTAGAGNQIYLDLPTICNCTYSNIQDGWPGTGNIDEDPLFVPGPDGEYYLSQPPCQTILSPCVDAGDPASPLIDGTTRTDGVPDAGIVDMGYHYPAFSPPPPPPPLTITLTPYNPPIVIPASGGSFDYNIEAANLESLMVNCDVWIDVTLPDSSIFGPVVGPVNIDLPGGVSFGRDRTQTVPINAPSGIYSYNAYIGVYPDSVVDTDSFPFEKLETGDGARVESWANWGELFNCRGDSRIAPTDALEAYVLGQTHPNPFNPTTVISFQLPVASWVKLEVFDISGRLVGAHGGAPIINGWRDAGNHEVIFDASGLASGIYIARLEAKPSLSGQAGSFHASRKMVLVK